MWISDEGALPFRSSSARSEHWKEEAPTLQLKTLPPPTARQTLIFLIPLYILTLTWRSLLTRCMALTISGSWTPTIRTALRNTRSLHLPLARILPLEVRESLILCKFEPNFEFEDVKSCYIKIIFCFLLLNPHWFMYDLIYNMKY